MTQADLDEEGTALWILADWFSDTFRKNGWTWAGGVPSPSEIVRTIRELKGSLSEYKPAAPWIESGRIRLSKNENGTYDVLLVAASVDEIKIPDEAE